MTNLVELCDSIRHRSESKISLKNGVLNSSNVHAYHIFLSFCPYSLINSHSNAMNKDTGYELRPSYFDIERFSPLKLSNIYISQSRIYIPLLRKKINRIYIYIKSTYIYHYINDG